MITTTLADNLAKIGDPIETDTVASGLWYDIGGIIFLAILAIIAGFVIRQAVRNSKEDRFGPPAARNSHPGEPTRFIDKLRNALTSTRAITPANRALSDTADFATFAPDHGPITIHSTRLGQMRTVTIPLADGRSRARKRAALAALTTTGRTPIAPALRTGTPPIYAVPVTPAKTATRTGTQVR